MKKETKNNAISGRDEKALYFNNAVIAWYSALNPSLKTSYSVGTRETRVQNKLRFGAQGAVREGARKHSEESIRK